VSNIGIRSPLLSYRTFNHLDYSAVGTEFTADYKGKTYSGVVKDGKLELSDGHKFSTPSAAAMHVTQTNVNGWRFWRCKVPGSAQYVLIERLRGKPHV
jgi:hypothetical protein